MNNEKEDWALEQDLKYNRLTAFKLFAMTSSMVISVDELAPFGKTGATALFYLLIAGIAWFIPITQMAGEMASIDGWEKGGIFTWVKGSLGDKMGWTAMFYRNVLPMDSHYCGDGHDDVRDYWCIVDCFWNSLV